MSEIYNENSSAILLGILCNDSVKYLDSKYTLESNDFKPILLHQIVFGVCKNLAIKGARNIDIIEVEEFLKNYETQYNVYKENNGSEFINTIKQLGENSKDNIDYYYSNVRKNSLLREYDNNGFDIKEIWDVDKSIEINENSLDKWEIETICDFFDKKQSEINKKYRLSSYTEEMIVGDGVEELLDEFEESPMIGAGLVSPMLNSLYRGWCKGHLILRGSPSSFGKTTMGIADACNVSSLKIWSDEKKDFIDNPYYQGMGAYCHSEQKMRNEIQPRFLSTISGIPYNIILDGAFKPDEKERLIEAGHIMKESNFKLINYPEFTSSGIKELIRDLSLNGYEYFTQDYTWNNFYIISDLKKINGNNVIREDQALLHFIDTLKSSAEQYDMAVATMIQLNGRQNEVELVDESCLFGSKSIKTKLDNGSIYMQPRKKELSQVELLIAKWNKKNNPNPFGNMIYPNAVSHTFKTRYNRYGMNLKVWHYVDNSIGKMTDMFCTTWNNEPLTDKDGKTFELPKLYIERKVK